MKKQTKAKSSYKTNKQNISNMKYEIANEFGVNLGADASAKANGSVGGEITKRLVQMGESKLGGSKTTKK